MHWRIVQPANLSRGWTRRGHENLERSDSWKEFLEEFGRCSFFSSILVRIKVIFFLLSSRKKRYLSNIFEERVNEVFYFVRKIGSKKFSSSLFFCWIIILIEIRGVILLVERVVNKFFKGILRNLEKEMLRFVWLINWIYKFRKVITYYNRLYNIVDAV